MSIRTRTIFVLAAALMLTTIIAACRTGPTTVEIVETTKAQNKIDNATATAEVIIAQGGDPDKVEVSVGTNSAAARAAQEQAATATAQAEQGIIKQSVGGSSADQSAEGAAFEVEVPEGSAQTGVIEIQVLALGAERVVFDPDVVKIAAGSTVKWINDRRSASSTTAHPGQGEQWDSGSMSRGPFDKEAPSFEHTFNTAGCFTYLSQYSGDTATGAICVE